MTYVELPLLQARLEWDLSVEEQRVAVSALEDLSLDAAHHGRAWTNETIPPIVKRYILAAATRYMKNLEGAVQSRAGDETLVLASVTKEAAEQMGSAHFSTEEIKAIIALAMGYNAGIGSIQVSVSNPTPRGARAAGASERVPVDYGNPGRTFPFFGDGAFG